MFTKTTTRLIEDLRNPENSAAWTAFDARYRPVLIAFARKLGFNADDAAELAQRTLAEFVQSYMNGNYSRQQGRLSSWLIGIARNIGSSMRRKRGSGAKVGGDTMIGEMSGELPDEHQLTRVWQREREQVILFEALERLRSASKSDANTIRAFELFAIKGMPAEAVASECAMTVDHVYVIKNRLTKRLREIVREITSAYDEGE